MINENILDKCFRISSSFINPRISPLTIKYEYPQLSLLIITPPLETNKIGVKSYSIIPCLCIQGKKNACFKHSNFFKVNDPELKPPTQLRAEGSRLEGRIKGPVHTIPADRALYIPKSNYELFNCSNFNIALSKEREIKFPFSLELLSLFFCFFFVGKKKRRLSSQELVSQ